MNEEEDPKEYRWESGYEKTWLVYSHFARIPIKYTNYYTILNLQVTANVMHSFLYVIANLNCA